MANNRLTGDQEGVLALWAIVGISLWKPVKWTLQTAVGLFLLRLIGVHF